MTRIQFTVLAITAALMSCGPGRGSGTAEPMRVVRGTTDGPSEGDAYDAPAHRFSPRSSTRTERYARVPSPDTARLPGMVERFRQCYGVYEREESKIAAPSGPVPSPVMARNGDNKRASSSSRGRGAGSAGSGAIGGTAKSAEKPAASPTPMPAMAAEAAAAPGGPEGSAPMYDNEAPSVIASDADDQLSDYENWGAAIYLSNDDSMSLSSAQRVIYAIDNFLPLPVEHIRPHELLNYFSFETAAVDKGRDFSLLPDIAPDPASSGGYTLSLAVSGRPVTRKTRPNVVLTWVIDRSGSMSAEGRMEYLKRGLMKSLSELKDGDMIHMVLFDHNVCNPIENFVVGRDNMKTLQDAINHLRPMGATDLHRGLAEGYGIADATYQPTYSNRVILVTDALTNTGVTDESLISTVSKHYDARRIRLSGVGVGSDFNDSLLDRLTERGRGAYVFLGSEAEVDAVFGPRFISLIETTALDVHFRLHLPPSLRMNVFYGEESSTVKADVQSIHYFANTSQLFLSDLIARGGALRPQDDIMLTVEYQDPETQEPLIHEEAFRLGDITADSAFNINKGRLIMSWIDLITVLASRQSPSVYRYVEGAYDDPESWQICEDGKALLADRSHELKSDRESTRVLQLFDKYCSRFERPRNPVRRQLPDGSWPGALPEESR